MADYEEGWDFDEEYLSRLAPSALEPLRLLVYRRCEDDWVKPAGLNDDHR